MRSLERQRRAFTLIELLIVVAIIAILALIAVPNFLEAQTRAKVSRVKADMRSLGVAIHAYTVDYSIHPIGWADGVVNYGLWDWLPGRDSNIGPYRQFTTPVAYITTIPECPFSRYARGNTYATTPETHFGWYYHYEGVEHLGSSDPLRARGYRWHLRSVGPSRTFSGVWPETIMANGMTESIYDPTNGTVSIGWIIYTNKGFYAGGPY